MQKMLKILLLEDDQDDALIIRETLEQSGMEFQLNVVETQADYLTSLDSGFFNLILSDSGIRGYSAIAAFKAARSKCPEVPFIGVSGLSAEDEQAGKLKEIGAPFVSKQKLNGLVPTIKMVLSGGAQQRPSSKFVPYNEAMEHLVEVVQQLSLARSLDAIMEIVRHAARELTGADGATFVLRDGDLCHYAQEDAISPLWKGQRFPMSACISGWAMLNRQAAVIGDIYADERIPTDAYRPTFVKSLVMVPIRSASPIGAIGTYWARKCQPPKEVVKVLQALADTTSVAMENLQLYQDLERRVGERTAELESSNEKLRIANTKLQMANEELGFLNKELETFTGAVSHDLRAPVRRIATFSEMLGVRCDENLDEKSKDYVQRIRLSADRISELIEDLLVLSRATLAPVKRDMVDMSGLAREIVQDLRSGDTERRAEFIIADGISANGDRGLLRTALENLLGNAFKYSSKRVDALIEFGAMQEQDGRRVYFVKDNGAGFNMEEAEKLFTPFQRLHAAADFPGTGVGLATVQRIIRKHGGRIWAEAAVDSGATFHFSLEQSAI
ncbi:MAG: ATP-binding protein [Syntrophobacteraceae bacterium]